MAFDRWQGRTFLTNTGQLVHSPTGCPLSCVTSTNQCTLLQQSTPEHRPRPAGSSVHDFESLDYDICDNTVHKANEALKGPADPLVYRAVKYSICFLIGVTIAITAFGVNFGVENIAGTKFWLTFRAIRCAHPLN